MVDIHLRVTAKLIILAATVSLTGCARTNSDGLSLDFEKAAQKCLLVLDEASDLASDFPLEPVDREKVPSRAGVLKARALLLDAGGSRKTPVDDKAYLILDRYANLVERVGGENNVRSAAFGAGKLKELTSPKETEKMIECGREAHDWLDPAWQIARARKPPVEGPCLRDAEKPPAELH